MAIEVIDQANPPPLASQLPVDCLLLAQSLHPTALDEKTHENIKAFRRAADYIAAGKYFILGRRMQLDMNSSYDLPRGQCTVRPRSSGQRYQATIVG